MPPSRIMLIRHAEKPVPDRAQGMRARGAIDEASLTALGWQRAGALVQFFVRPTAPAIGRPDRLYAVRYERDRAGSSRRSRQTVRPLARFSGLLVDDRFGAGQEEQVAKAVLLESGNVLIAWSHENLPRLAAALARQLAHDAAIPAEWPDDRFDVVWVFEPNAKRRTFVQVPQLLLAGDRETPIPVAVERGGSA